ncbi:MAG: TetR/AcrR family transcriptional regulator [Microbacterium sp.]
MTTKAAADERIWRAALALFAKQGFAGTSTRDIAEASDLTPGSLYHYMGSKDDLLEQVMFGGMTGLLQASRALAEATVEPVPTVAGLIRLHVQVHAKHRFETKVVDSEVEQLGSANRKRIVAMRDEYELLWFTTISAGLAKEQFWVSNPRLATLGLLGMCTEVSTWYRPGGRMTPGDLGWEFADMGLAMLRAKDEHGRAAAIGGVSTLDLSPYLAIYEQRGGYGMVAAKATSRSAT